jgi:hypothetical protein
VLILVIAVALLSLSKPDPTWGTYAIPIFGGLFALAGILCGLIGYVLVAAVRPSHATAGASCIAGAAAAAPIILVSVFSGPYVPDRFRFLITGAVCAALGAGSYAVVNRVRSNNRWRGP